MDVARETREGGPMMKVLPQAGVVCALLVLASVASHGQDVVRGPVDEAIADSALVAVRDRTLSAVRRRDAAALAEIADSEGGLSARVLQIPTGDDSTWRALEAALVHGGRFLVDSRGDRLFCSPWAVSSPSFVDPPDDILGPEGLAPAAVLESSPVFSDRGLAGPPLASIPPGYVRVVEEAMPSAGVVAVQLPGGDRGWIARRALWMESDAPLCFGHRDGAWRMVRMGN